MTLGVKYQGLFVPPNIYHENYGCSSHAIHGLLLLKYRAICVSFKGSKQLPHGDSM